ncbi:hypothetical protein CGLO_12127 [Colletotrichum gloeosporioides Cg-14]|uniref:2EXR domain-containing protein n=1 Tax=Colletotrichum gloeosporioides (strain Cg-14) TaxID=1237896 RepID=T0JZE1_COLGC|nr:hypothetical protein CGLO_12127 [Colletotrichum gloeosporioides Cg-14]
MKSFFSKFIAPREAKPATQASPEELYDAIEPQIKGNLEIAIDSTNRERWPDVILKARRHMRCHPYHPKRLPKSYRPFQMVVDPPSDESHETNDGSSRPALTTFPVFMDLPKELRDKIMLMSQTPTVMQGKVVIDLEWREGPQIHFQPYRSWSSVSLYSVSRETRALAITYFGEPQPDSIPFNSSHDFVEVDWNGSMQAERSWTGDHKGPGPVLVTRRRNVTEKEWPMPRDLCERIQHVVIDGRNAAFEDDSKKGPWRLAFGLLRDYFKNLRILDITLWDLDDARSDRAYDTVSQELYRIDQLDFLDELEDMSSDGHTPFLKLECVSIIPELPTPLQAEREQFKFRTLKGSHFRIINSGELPRAGLML